MSQGRVLSTPCIDYQMSNCYLTNSAITGNLVKLIYKCRMQLLACNSLLHRYYPSVYPKSCPLCHNPYDTVVEFKSFVMNNKVFGNLLCNSQKSFTPLRDLPTRTIEVINHSSNSTMAFVFAKNPRRIFFFFFFL